MKILNLYACLGGNRKLWGDEHEITAVELDPELVRMYQERFSNDTVIVADAHQYLLDHYQEFDFIWSSPPCPTHSKMMKATRHDVVCYVDMKLYQEIILLDNFFKGKYVVENVVSYYQPLITPYQSSRHYYWSNFKITPCLDVPKIKDMSKANRKKMAKYLGFDYPGPNFYVKGNHCPAQVLRNCVHPIEGKHILDLALGIHKANNANQLSLL
jgi:DNA (cytosine-5)-methyltransferase 1